MLKKKYLLLIVLSILPLSILANVNIDVKTYIPKNAFDNLPILKKEQQRLLPNFEYPEYFAGLIEHESCISLTHPKCWNPKSRLKTSREEGAGLPQLTRAYNESGQIKFDTIADLRKAYADELNELTWSNVYNRPDLQIRAMLLLFMNNYKKLYSVKDNFQRLAMADSAYNGGLGHTLKERKICGLKKDCNPQIWFDNVENIVVKSTKPLYAGRSPFTINRHHVRDVLYNRMPKYKIYLIKNKLVNEKDISKAIFVENLFNLINAQ